MWTSEQLAYMAGIIDGEGSIGIEKQKANGKQRKHDYYCLRLRVYNTNFELITWLLNNFGGNYFKNTKYKGRKQCYSWTLFGDNLLQVITACEPYFIVKKNLIEIVMEFRKTVIGKTNWNIPKDIQEYRHALFLKAKAINKIGDHTTSPLSP